MRVVDYFAVAGKELGRQRVRSGLTVVALAISTAILVAMAALSLGGRRAIVQQLSPDDSLTSIVVTPNQSTGTLSPFGSVQQVNNSAAKLDDNTVATLVKLSHVSQALPEAHVWEFKSFTVAGSKPLVAQGNGISDVAAIPLAAGTGFTPDSTSSVAIVGHAYAEALGYGKHPADLVGKTMQITTVDGYRGAGADIPGPSASAATNDAFNRAPTTLPVTIVGVGKQGSSQNSFFVPLNWARDVRTVHFYAGSALKTTDQVTNDGYTTVLVKVDSANNVKSVASVIDGLGYGEVSTAAEVDRLQQVSTVMWVILGSVAAIAVVAAALGVVNTMLMAVSEQRYTIGVWRAFGARRAQIARQFLLEAALLGLAGGAVGAGLGILIGHFVNQRVSSLLQTQGLSVTSVAEIPPWLLAGAIALTTLFGVIAGLYPAWRAARQDPAEALSSGQ